MGKKGSWFSAVKKALTPDSKEKKDQVFISNFYHTLLLKHYLKPFFTSHSFQILCLAENPKAEEEMVWEEKQRRLRRSHHGFLGSSGAKRGSSGEAEGDRE